LQLLHAGYRLVPKVMVTLSDL